MTSSIQIRYTGKKFKFDRAHPVIDDRKRLYRPYRPDQDLIDAVNLAIDLERPLLLEGRPGCGKTELAAAIAYEFTQEYGKYLPAGETWWPWDTWNVKSTEQAQDGLYTFDGIGQLRDAQLSGVLGSVESAIQKRVLDRLGYDEQKDPDGKQHPYIKIGKLGRLLQNPCRPPVRPIILIDEIDKADADFPNDLLMELDKNQFEVKETGKCYPREEPADITKPIVIITSNRERPLSDAFLRRCLYFSLDFPSETCLRELITDHFPQLSKDDAVVNETWLALDSICKVLEHDPGAKLPGTSEVLDLVKHLQQKPADLPKMKELGKHQPLLGILLKTRQDQERYRAAQEQG
jgi:MoxR-like ATPase